MNKVVEKKAPPVNPAQGQVLTMVSSHFEHPHPVEVNRSRVLSDAEIEQFVIQGYVVKKKVLVPELMRKAVAVMWENMPEHLKRDDPSSWRGAVTDCRGPSTISRKKGKVKLRREIWANETLDTLITHNDHIFSLVEQLLGQGNVSRPQRFRGLYPIFPTPEHKNTPVKAHVDKVTRLLRFKVGVVAYLQDVPLHGGGFMVWPGSHRTLYYENGYIDDNKHLKTKKFREYFRRINNTEPVEIPGEAGDIILFHYCLMHAAGINSLEGHVRQAAFCNFNTTGREEDTQNPPAENMWDGWKSIMAVNSPRIQEASDKPLDPLLGKRPVLRRAWAIKFDRIRRGIVYRVLGLR
ncbi:MAG: phytanoyl-CoA dioxygenase family protein [Candidatus Binatia bacterium]